MSTSTSSSRKQRMGWASSSSGIYHHLEDNSNLSISPSSTGSMTGISLKSPTSTTTPSAASKRAGGMKRTHRLLRMFILPTLAVSVVYLQIHSLGFVVGGDWQQELDHMALWSPSTSSSSTTQSTSSQSTQHSTKTHQKSKHPFVHGTTPLHKLEEHRLRHVFQHSQPKTKTTQQAQSAISESERRLQSKTAAVTTLVPNNNNEEDPQELHELFMAQKQKRHNNNKDQTHDQVVAEFRRHAHDDNKAMLLNHFEKYQRLQHHHHRDNDSSLLVQTKKHLNRQEYAVPTKQRQPDDSDEEDSPIPGTSKAVYDLVMKKRHQLDLLRTRNKDQGIRNRMVKHNEVKDESLEDDDELADEEEADNNNSISSTNKKKKKKKGTLLTKKHKGRQRPKEKVLFFVHIHKSGGTVLCAMAHANKLHVNTKHNCNVQTNQRCCGKSDDKEIQTAYAQQTPYDLVAAETQMYQGMDPTHYNYIVVLRSSRERYFSHWKHILRDVPPRRKPMSTTRKGIVGKAQHSSLEAAPRLHYKPKTAEMQQVIDRLSKFQQQFEPQAPVVPQETTTKLQDPLQHIYDKEAADKKGYGDEKAKPMHHLTTTDQDVKDKVAHWKQQVAVRQQERNQQHAIDNLEQKRDHEQRAAAHAREMSSHKKHHEQRLLLEEEPHPEEEPIRVRDGAPGDKAVNDAKARRAKHLVALKQQGTEEEEEGGEKKKQKDDEEEDEDDGDDDEEEEKGEQQKGVDGNDKEGDNKPTPASTHTPQKRLGPKLVMPLQTRPEKPPKNLEHPAQHVPLPKKTKPVIGHTFEEWWSLQPDNWNFRQLCGTHCMGVPKYQLTLQHWQYTLDRFLQFHTVLFLEDLQDSMDVLAERLKWGQANMTAVQEAEKKERDRKARRKAEGKRARPLKTTRIPRATYPPLQPPNTTVAFASWDPLMSALDDALYDIGRRWEKLKREQKAPVQSLEVVAADGSTTTAPAHAGMLSSLTAMESLPADLLKHFERYFRDEPHNHRHQCEDECCHPICSKW
ncbi:expressed unknown protein [Seminavis robusta]|uniref:Sulfotransferase domain-containing protein n=1 Tax=Seminavis robusta TaxID=568900 RepID=A0A9N8H416_9STRA|nr:expressed unknown protein [Seminavis robusta]|eukprot:Sro39_g024050.1 n/a (1016) ;mRNA; r:44929-48101